MVHLVSSLGSLTATLAVGAFGWWLFSDDGPPDDGGGGDWEPVVVPRAPCSVSLGRAYRRTTCLRTRPRAPRRLRPPSTAKPPAHAATPTSGSVGEPPVAGRELRAART